MAKQKDETTNEPEPEPTPTSKPKPSYNPSNDLMTTKELMDYLMVSRTKVWELVNKKGLPAFKIGFDYRYRRAEVDKWIEDQRVVPEKKPDEKSKK